MQFWEEIWQRYRKKSHLKQTQRLNPENRQAFYDRVSSLCLKEAVHLNPDVTKQ